MKKVIIAIVILFVLIGVAILVVGRTFYPDNIAETSENGGMKGLKTRFYDSDVETVRSSAKSVLGKMSTWGSAWKIVEETGDGGNFRIKVEVPVVIFTDDLEIKIDTVSEDRVRVDVRSASRVGKSDFGENARHVNQFLSGLDEALKR